MSKHLTLTDRAIIEKHIAQDMSFAQHKHTYTSTYQKRKLPQAASLITYLINKFEMFNQKLYFG